MNKISDKTFIPLFVAIGCVPVIIWSCFWLYSVRSDASDGAEAKQLYYKIDKRLDRIEIKLGTKPKNED